MKGNGKFAALVRAYFFLTTAAFLIAITCFSLVQGLLVHFGGAMTDAFIFYFLGWVTLGAGLLLFAHGRSKLRVISIS
ncbi:hypothetical protein KKE06_05015 [Candidatus Micrarchaeota archaeon]|nr:hypothetical protein [Candidatus Micrarchaeota archaeon]MBU1930241.1 hypothetical protein [Candidatus Micrarchaeota archaeon]